MWTSYLEFSHQYGPVAFGMLLLGIIVTISYVVRTARRIKKLDDEASANYDQADAWRFIARVGKTELMLLWKEEMRATLDHWERIDPNVDRSFFEGAIKQAFFRFALVRLIATPDDEFVRVFLEELTTLQREYKISFADWSETIGEGEYSILLRQVQQRAYESFVGIEQEPELALCYEQYVRLYSDHPYDWKSNGFFDAEVTNDLHLVIVGRIQCHVNGFIMEVEKKLDESTQRQPSWYLSRLKHLSRCLDMKFFLNEATRTKLRTLYQRLEKDGAFREASLAEFASVIDKVNKEL